MTERVYPSCPFNSIIACEMKLIHRENPCEGCNNYNEDALIEKPVDPCIDKIKE